jgi:RNA polymerase sigma-70 factor (ECF subfamily)
LGAELDDLVAAGIDAIESRFSNPPVDDPAFAEHVAERFAARAEVARFQLGDAFVAWWAGTGKPEGLAAFEAEYGNELRRIASRFPALPLDDLQQQLRIKLFVGPSARIREYSGFGSLLAWLRVVAVRAFVDIVRSNRSRRYYEELDESELLGFPASREAGVSPELAGAVKRAFADAVAGLAPRQRAFLRHAYIDKLTLDQIAATYSIHRATVARTLASARAQLIDRTREGVVAELGVAPNELASALGTVDKRLELSLSRLLRAS